MKKIIIGSDHAGFKMKEKIKEELKSEYDFIDMGTDNESSTDYPIYGSKVAKQVSITPEGTGIVICGSGVGVSITANKINGIRCALAYNKKTAELSRLHNNANILAIAGREETVDNPIEIVKTFLETEFSNEERHVKRIKLIEKLENK